MIKSTSHHKSKNQKLILEDLKAFLFVNQACECKVVTENIDFEGKKDVIQIRGKVEVQLPQPGQTKQVGYKFILPHNYPEVPPLAFLDEPVRNEVVEIIDYLRDGNVIMFDFLNHWTGVGDEIGQNVEKYNLINLLNRVTELYTMIPPLTIEELFGV